MGKIRTKIQKLKISNCESSQRVSWFFQIYSDISLDQYFKKLNYFPGDDFEPHYFIKVKNIVYQNQSYKGFSWGRETTGVMLELAAV